MTKFYKFIQNNSYGVFELDDNVGHYVFIEAENSADANKRAEELGIYFDGVRSEKDCPCCGDRWYRVDENSASTTIAPLSEISPYDNDVRIVVHYLNGVKSLITA